MNQTELIKQLLRAAGFTPEDHNATNSAILLASALDLYAFSALTEVKNQIHDLKRDHPGYDLPASEVIAVIERVAWNYRARELTNQP